MLLSKKYLKTERAHDIIRGRDMKYGHTNRGVSGALYPQSAIAGAIYPIRALFVSPRRKSFVEKRVLAQFAPVKYVR